jgi:hypothetical protein
VVLGGGKLFIRKDRQHLLSPERLDLGRFGFRALVAAVQRGPDLLRINQADVGRRIVSPAFCVVSNIPSRRPRRSRSTTAAILRVNPDKALGV